MQILSTLSFPTIQIIIACRIQVISKDHLRCRIEEFCEGGGSPSWSDQVREAGGDHITRRGEMRLRSLTVDLSSCSQVHLFEDALPDQFRHAMFRQLRSSLCESARWWKAGKEDRSPPNPILECSEIKLCWVAEKYLVGDVVRMLRSKAIAGKGCREKKALEAIGKYDVATENVGNLVSCCFRFGMFVLRGMRSGKGKTMFYERW